MTEKVTVIGAGLAGSEAAWQLAKRGIKVDLYEMRPKKMTPAHESGNFAELVCTNSMAVQPAFKRCWPLERRNAADGFLDHASR